MRRCLDALGAVDVLVGNGYTIQGAQGLACATARIRCGRGSQGACGVYMQEGTQFGVRGDAAQVAPAIAMLKSGVTALGFPWTPFQA